MHGGMQTAAHVRGAHPKNGLEPVELQLHADSGTVGVEENIIGTSISRDGTGPPQQFVCTRRTHLN